MRSEKRRQRRSSSLIKPDDDRIPVKRVASRRSRRRCASCGRPKTAGIQDDAERWIRAFKETHKIYRKAMKRLKDERDLLKSFGNEAADLLLSPPTMGGSYHYKPDDLAQYWLMPLIKKQVGKHPHPTEGQRAQDWLDAWFNTDRRAREGINNYIGSATDRLIDSLKGFARTEEAALKKFVEPGVAEHGWKGLLDRLI